MGRGPFRGGRAAAGRRASAKDKSLSATEARAQMTMLLVNCSDDRLADLTADRLASMYRVPPLECAEALEQQRARRRSPGLEGVL